MVIYTKCTIWNVLTFVGISQLPLKLCAYSNKVAIVVVKYSDSVSVISITKLRKHI